LLTVITEKFYRALDRRGDIRAISLDISKAFDKVWHAGLLRKLSSYGISGNVFKIIESFLTNRSIKVVLDGQHSSSFPVTSGVPQGSILGPILFLIYINDLPELFTSKVALFADDTTIYSCCDKKPTLSDCLEVASELENDLTSATKWGSKWLVNFNANKTQYFSANHYRNNLDLPISMNGDVLEESSTLRLLGLTFSSDLSWKPYIKSIAKLASAKVASLYRARHFLTPDSILYLYKSLIRPCMEYCCHIWGGSSNDALSLLDKVQRRIVNIVGPALAANLQPLSHRRNVASLSLFYKYYNGRCSKELASLVPSTKIHSRVTRHSIKSHPFTVTVPKCSKNSYLSSFFPRTSVLWNSLPSSCFPDSYNLQSFKSSVNCYLAL
jgi:ribonucleases P/MRP protein subunit RPP40